MTLQKLKDENRIMSFIKRSIGVHAKKLGYNDSLLIQRVESLMKRYQIMIYNLQGMKMKALSQAAMFNEFLPDDTFFYKAGSKATLLFTVMISSRLHLWLQRSYRSLLYLLHRNL